MWVSYQLNLKFSCKELAQLDQRTQKSDQPDHLEKDKICTESYCKEKENVEQIQGRKLCVNPNDPMFDIACSWWVCNLLSWGKPGGKTFYHLIKNRNDTLLFRTWSLWPFFNSCIKLLSGHWDVIFFSSMP